MRRYLLPLVGALLVTLAGCSSTVPEADPVPNDPPSHSIEQDTFLAAHDLDGMAGEAIVDHLDRLPVVDRPTDLMASVRPDHLLLADTEQEVPIPLGEGQFYLSVAPYIEQTHDCFNHSLTTCRGELGNQDIHVRITDSTGKTLTDEQVTTFDNGFAGFWLPKDVDATIEVTYDGLTGQTSFSTNEKGATCLTTLQLG